MSEGGTVWHIKAGIGDQENQRVLVLLKMALNILQLIGSVFLLVKMMNVLR